MVHLGRIGGLHPTQSGGTGGKSGTRREFIALFKIYVFRNSLAQITNQRFPRKRRGRTSQTNQTHQNEPKQTKTNQHKPKRSKTKQKATKQKATKPKSQKAKKNKSQHSQTHPNPHACKQYFYQAQGDVLHPFSNFASLQISKLFASCLVHTRCNLHSKFHQTNHTFTPHPALPDLLRGPPRELSKPHPLHDGPLDRLAIQSPLTKTRQSEASGSRHGKFHVQMFVFLR